MTSDGQDNPLARRAVLLASLALFGVWVALHYGRLTDPRGGSLVPFVLGLVFGLLIIFRAKPAGEFLRLPGWAAPAAAVGGALGVVLGLVLGVHQLEWLGLLLVFFACLTWALPARYGRDVLFGLLLVYWMHPLPAQVFGPLQIGMQRLSVLCSEWVLQSLNVRVWGDELVLRTGLRVFGVPEACSGMKTAVTVLLCLVGLGILFRRAWWEVLALVALGLVQVLVLNVLRITGIVYFGAQMPPDWSDKTLHDTMGIFLLLAVALAHLDAVLWRQWRTRRARMRRLRELGDEVGEPDDKARRMPRFWLFLWTWGGGTLAVVLIGGAAAFVVVRSQPSHRVEMLRGVIEGLRRQDDLVNAERAVRAGLRIAPRDAGLQYDLMAVQFLRGEYDTVLAGVAAIPPEARSMEVTLLHAQTLSETGRLEESLKVVESLPPETHKLPGVAMLLAEFAAQLDRPEDVARHLARACEGMGTEERIRRLFPYLAANEMWDTIRKADMNMPYSDPVQGLAAATACIQANDLDGAALVLQRAMRSWEKDPIYLAPLLMMMQQRPGAEWEQHFARAFKASAARLEVKDLSRYLEGSFQAGRPDLAWLAYRHLRAKAPDDPFLELAPVEFAPVWLVGRRRSLGVEAKEADEALDLAPWYRLTRGAPFWRAFWARVPLVEELQDGLSVAERQQHLEAALAALRRAEAAGTLDERLESLYPRVLSLLERWDEADAKLAEFAVRHPAKKRELTLERAALYRRKKEWQRAYELQAEVFRAERRPRQTTALEFADTLAWLGLGGFAMGVLEEARLWYPESTSVPAAMAGAWDMYGFYEDALYALRRIGGGTPALRLRLYVRTGRFVEARKLAFAEGLEVPSTAAVRQGEVLPPAAQALEWRSGGLTDSLCAKMISDLTAQLPKCTSPYVKGLWQKQLDWYRARGAGDTSNQQAWEAVGRDPREKAEALKTLGLLLGAQGRLAEARAALEAAVRHAPRWSVLRRMQVALAQGDAEIVEQAWASCPWEGEVWLGHLVQRFRKQGAGPWAAAEVRAAVDGKRYNPGTFVRAGDFLFAGRMPDAAAAAAQHALAEGDGLLAAYAFGLRCALVQTNRAWALECALGGAERAVEPWPFHKAIVALKTVETKMDADLVRSLEALIAHFPDEYRWSEMLGHAYFRRGEPANAFAVLDRLLRRAGPEKVDKEALLVAAEAARLEGSTARSLELLAAAYRLYPDDLSVLNNYVYYLAQNPAQVARALDLLPELLRKGEKRFFAYDTAAMVSLKAGQLDKAELYMERAVDLVDPARYGWHEVYLNAAELQLSLGNYRDARDYLTRVRKDARRTPAVENRARDLLAEVARREREAQPRN